MSGHTPPTRVTACMIDGSTISATVVEHSDGVARVVATELVELPTLVESIERRHHPIFMDFTALAYKDPAAIRRILEAIFADPTFRNPVLGVFPGDAVTEYQLHGESSSRGRDERRRALLKRIQWTNPYRYPTVFMLHEQEGSEGLSTTRLLEVRLDDFVHSAAQFEGIGTECLGVVTAQRAASQLFPHLPHSSRAKPVTMIDIGKNRTLYSTWVPGGRFMQNAIPVGLARDDAHIFNAIPPSIELILEMQDRIGGMFLLPPEATPTPLFASRKSTPQIDCTRFAVQIARFANRTIESVPAQLGWQGEHDGTVYLIGRGARLPGLPAYLYSWTEADLYAFETAPLESITLDSSVEWKALSDTPATLGAALAFFARGEDSFGMLLREQRIRRLSSGILRVDDLQDNTLYVSEQNYSLIE